MKSLRRFFRQPVAAIAFAFVFLVVFASAFAGAISPFDPLEQDLANANSLPSSLHPLGADTLGRDILSRLLFGGRVTLSGSLIAVVVFIGLGLPLGLLAGYRRGRVDAILSRVVEVLFATPAVIILLVVLSVFSTNLAAAMITLGVLGLGSLFRVVRGSTIAASSELYVKAARAGGLSEPAVMWRHVLPNLWGPVIVQVSLFFAGAVLTSGLAFLGFSVQAPAPSWGAMIGDASTQIGSHPWLLVPPGVLIGLMVLAFGLIGDGVRDAVALASRGSTAHQTSSSADLPSRPVPAPNASAILSIRDLSVAFGPVGSPMVVVRNVNLDVMPGEALGIVGESGSGKTVTARAVLGLLGPTGRVVGGSFWYKGREILAGDDRAIRQLRGGEIGLVPQEPMTSLDPVFTIGSQLSEVVRRHDATNRALTRKRVIELLEMVRIPEPETVYRRFPHELSGGMAQRVGIALALAGRPALLLADEPTTALDVTVQKQVLELLVELQHRLDMAIVLVTHDWGVLAQLCDRAVVMYAGEVVEDATVSEIFARPLHPYTRALIASNPQNAKPRSALPSIAGQVPPPLEWPLGCHFANRCALVQPDCEEGPIEMFEPAKGRHSRCVHTGVMVGSA